MSSNATDPKPGAAPMTDVDHKDEKQFKVYSKVEIQSWFEKTFAEDWQDETTQGLFKKLNINGQELIDRSRDDLKEHFGDVLGVSVFNAKEKFSNAKEKDPDTVERVKKRKTSDDPLLKFFLNLFSDFCLSPFSCEFKADGETVQMSGTRLNLPPPADVQDLISLSGIYVRDCFSELAELFIGHPHKNMLLWGASGVGKTTFTSFFIHQLMRQKDVKTIAYSLQSSGLVVLIDVQKRLAEFSTDHGVISQADWTILDASLTQRPSSGRCLFVTSPTKASQRPEFYQAVKNRVLGDSIFLLPEWEEEELQLLKYGLLKDQVPESDFWERFKCLGGVPRKLISSNLSAPGSLFKSPPAMLEALIKISTSDKLRDITDGFLKGQAIPDDVNGTLVTYREKDFRYDGLRFVSDYVRDQIVKEWDTKNKDGLRAWIKSASNDPSAAGLAGHLFEDLAHGRFERKSADPIELNGRDLSSGKKCSLSVQVKKILEDRAPFNKPGAVKVAKNSDPDCYYRPCIGNLPAFDAFIVQEDQLILFQFTVAKAHAVQAHFLTQFVNSALGVHKKVTTVTVAFVSEKAPKLDGVQPYKGTKKNPLKYQDIAKGFIRKVNLRQVELELTDF